MESLYEITKIFKTDCAEKLPVFFNTYGLQEFANSETLLHALAHKAKKCVIWFLQNGWYPNERSISGANILLISCLYSCAYQEMVTTGARVEIQEDTWNGIYAVWKYSATSTSYFPAIYKMFLLGLSLPKNPPHYIPPPCYDAYRVILAREKACKEACYTFIRINGLPRDLVRWMLETFILPSKREYYWSDLPMPEGFV